MTDPQRLIDDIRSFTHATDQTYSDSLRALATAYVEACQDANQRLRRCEEFLRQGLRSEAIHFAQAEPNLLELLAVLDFPERSQWEQICVMYSLAAPPILRIATAEALNRAYAEERPLEHLLRRHRRLALEHAPVADRLGVLKQIARLDPGNPVWSEDAGAFEAVRLEQVERDVEQAFQARDSQALFDLYQELNANSWTVPPPPTLMDRVAQYVRHDANRAARARLSEVADSLEQARAAMDEPRARRLADEWQDLARRFPDVNANSPVGRRAAAVIQWLVRQNKLQEIEFAFEASLDTFQRALSDERVGEQKLQQLYNDVLRLGGEGVPDYLRDNYRARMSILAQAEKRRERIILAATFAVGAIVLVGFLMIAILHRGG